MTAMTVMTMAKATVTEDGVPALPGFVQVTYQLAGNGMKELGWFDLAIVADPGAWLTERLLGPLAGSRLALPQCWSWSGWRHTTGGNGGR